MQNPTGKLSHHEIVKVNRALESQFTNVPAARSRRLMQEFGRLAYRWRPRVSKNGQPLYAFLTAMGSQDAELPASETLKYAFRLLHKNNELENARELIDRFLAPHEITRRGLSEDDSRFRDRERARAEARVLGGDVLRALEQFLDYLAYPRRAPRIRFDNSGELKAHTDGSRITLPKYIQLSTVPELNFQTYAYLIIHEWGHSVLGSFDFKMSDSMWQKLRPRREVFKENRSAWEGEAVLRKIMDEEGEYQLDLNLSQLEAFFLHIDNPQALHFCYNLFEDIRIERWIASTGLKKVAELTAVLCYNLAPHPLLQSAYQNFTRSMTSLAYGVPVGHQVCRKFFKTYELISRLITDYRQRPLDQLKPETSAEYALKMYEHLENNLPKSSLDEMNREFAEKISVSITEIMLRRQIATIDGEGHEGFGPFFPQVEREIEDAHYSYPEFDARERRLKPDVVGLVESSFEPVRSPYASVVPLNLGLPPLALTRGTRRSKGQSPRLSAYGSDIAMHRLPEYVAGVKAGQRIHDVYWRRRRQGHGLVVNILLDLSISMEAPRPALGGQRPIEWAIDLTDWLSRELAAQHIDFGVFGGIDAGRRPVTFKIISDYGDPRYSQAIRRTHCVSVGGFRTGAYLRHIHSRAQEIADRQFTLILSDGGSGYQQLGYDDGIEKIQQRNCPACQERTRGKCPVEALLPTTTMRGGSSSGFYLPPRYEYTDIGEAMRDTGNTSLLVHFDETAPTELLDELLGRDRWMTCTSLTGAEQVTRRLGEMLAPA